MLATTATNKQILIVDRDTAAVEPLRRKLAEGGFDVSAVGDGSAAAASLAEKTPHLVILDWNIPGFAALELIQNVKRVRLPRVVRLIVLSALAGEQDVVTALDLGVDDYIAKPYSLREVLARVAALLRARPSEDSQATLKCSGLALDPQTNRVTAGEQLVSLRGVEYRLLEFLMTHPGRAFSRNQLLQQVWGDDRSVDERTVDVSVQRLRKTLADPGYGEFIHTVRGFGYRFCEP
jgi:two-component system, OmpR family, phosphate regulon response regulator PhoB